MPAMVNMKNKPETNMLSVTISFFRFCTDTYKGVFFLKYS